MTNTDIKFKIEQIESAISILTAKIELLELENRIKGGKKWNN